MARQPVRLKDIAAVTGVSANTVSLALRGVGRIPEETRSRIVAAARKLNYLPNQVAQSLVSRETKTVGLVLTSIVNPILTQAARAIERELAARGYSLMLSASENDIGKETEAIDVFRARQVDGMLIYAANHGMLDHIRPLRRAGYPIVLLVDDPGRRLDVVSVDDRRGAEIATDHLVGLGHRRIAFLDAGSPLGNLEKVEGYRRGLEKAGIGYDPGLLLDPRGHSAAEAYAAISAFLARGGERPTALLASNDLLAFGSLRACRDLGVDVPGDLAIVGFDDIEASNYAPVPLTTVHYGADELSKAAVDRLLALIGAPGRLPRARQSFIEPTLVVRESCGANARPRSRRPVRARGRSDGGGAVSDDPVRRPGPAFDRDGTRVRYGGCSCGAVRFKVWGEPVVVGLCHCLTCRKATGGVAMPYADWPAAAFSSEGTAREYAGRSFCPVCGSRLFHLSPATVEIPLGALDDAPGDLAPTREGWIIRREHWLAPVEGASQHDRDP